MRMASFRRLFWTHSSKYKMFLANMYGSDDTAIMAPMMLYMPDNAHCMIFTHDTMYNGKFSRLLDHGRRAHLQPVVCEAADAFSSRSLPYCQLQGVRSFYQGSAYPTPIIYKKFVQTCDYCFEQWPESNYSGTSGLSGQTPTPHFELNVLWKASSFDTMHLNKYNEPYNWGVSYYVLIPTVDDSSGAVWQISQNEQLNNYRVVNTRSTTSTAIGYSDVVNTMGSCPLRGSGWAHVAFRFTARGTYQYADGFPCGPPVELSPTYNAEFYKNAPRRFASSMHTFFGGKLPFVAEDFMITRDPDWDVVATMCADIERKVAASGSMKTCTGRQQVETQQSYRQFDVLFSVAFPPDASRHQGLVLQIGDYDSGVMLPAVIRLPSGHLQACYKSPLMENAMCIQTDDVVRSGSLGGSWWADDDINSLNANYVRLSWRVDAITGEAFWDTASSIVVETSDTAQSVFYDNDCHTGGGPQLDACTDHTGGILRFVASPGSATRIPLTRQHYGAEHIVGFPGRSAKLGNSLCMLQQVRVVEYGSPMYAIDLRYSDVDYVAAGEERVYGYPWDGLADAASLVPLVKYSQQNVHTFATFAGGTSNDRTHIERQSATRVKRDGVYATRQRYMTTNRVPLWMPSAQSNTLSVLVSGWTSQGTSLGAFNFGDSFWSSKFWVMENFNAIANALDPLSDTTNTCNNYGFCGAVADFGTNFEIVNATPVTALAGNVPVVMLFQIDDNAHTDEMHTTLRVMHAADPVPTTYVHTIRRGDVRRLQSIRHDKGWNQFKKSVVMYTYPNTKTDHTEILTGGASHVITHRVAHFNTPVSDSAMQDMWDSLHSARGVSIVADVSIPPDGETLHYSAMGARPLHCNEDIAAIMHESFNRGLYRCTGLNQSEICALVDDGYPGSKDTTRTDNQFYNSNAYHCVVGFSEWVPGCYFDSIIPKVQTNFQVNNDFSGMHSTYRVGWDAGQDTDKNDHSGYFAQSSPVKYVATENECLEECKRVYCRFYTHLTSSNEAQTLGVQDHGLCLVGYNPRIRGADVGTPFSTSNERRCYPYMTTSNAVGLRQAGGLQDAKPADTNRYKTKFVSHRYSDPEQTLDANKYFGDVMVNKVPSKWWVGDGGQRAQDRVLLISAAGGLTCSGQAASPNRARSKGIDTNCFFIQPEYLPPSDNFYLSSTQTGFAKGISTDYYCASVCSHINRYEHGYVRKSDQSRFDSNRADAPRAHCYG